MRGPRAVRWLLTSIVMAAALAMPSTAAATDYLGYPWPSANMNQISTFGFYYRNCTDFAAYRLNVQMGDTDNVPPHRFSWQDFTKPTGGNGNAYAWRDNALGWMAEGRSDQWGRPWRVDRTPAPGAVAWWGSTNHVAIVTGLYNDGTGDVQVDQYNAGLAGEPSSARRHAEEYLHIADTTPPPAPKSADVNSSGLVDIFDLSILLTQYGRPASANNAALNSDLNWDGTVDIFDLSILLSRYGTPGRAAARSTAAFTTAAAGDPAAGLSSMTLGPSATSVNAGDTVTVQVALNAGSATNAVEAQIAYPTNRFAYVGTQVDTNTWDVNTGVTTGDGIVNIDAGSSTPHSGQQALATMTFRALSAGPVPITLTGLSSVISAATNSETLVGIADTSGGGGGGEPSPDNPGGPIAAGSGQASNTSGASGAAQTAANSSGASRAVIAGVLRRLLMPTGPGARIGALLRAGAYRFAFTAPTAGRVTIAWYARPTGGARASARRALLATGSRHFKAAGQTARITVKLTAAGRAALHHGTRRLTARVTFAPAKGSRLHVSRTVRLKR